MLLSYTYIYISYTDSLKKILFQCYHLYPFYMKVPPPPRPQVEPGEADLFKVTLCYLYRQHKCLAITHWEYYENIMFISVSRKSLVSNYGTLL